jgi:hypothetical protein
MPVTAAHGLDASAAGWSAACGSAPSGRRSAIRLSWSILVDPHRDWLIGALDDATVRAMSWGGRGAARL